MTYRKIYINPTDWVDCHSIYLTKDCESCPVYGQLCDGEHDCETECQDDCDACPWNGVNCPGREDDGD